MTVDSIVEQVQTIVASVAGAHRTPAPVGPDTPLRDEGFWLDSVDLLEVLLACQSTFAIDFHAETDLTAEHLRTVGSLAEMIRSKMKGSPSP